MIILISLITSVFCFFIMIIIAMAAWKVIDYPEYLKKMQITMDMTEANLDFIMNQLIEIKKIINEK